MPRVLLKRCSGFNGSREEKSTHFRLSNENKGNVCGSDARAKSLRTKCVGNGWSKNRWVSIPIRGDPW